MGHLARDCLNPCTTCTYCRALDHATKDCPQLLVKWQERGNQNQNPNQNVQKISAEKHNEGPRIAVVMHGGARTGVDVMNGGRKVEQWVRKSTGPMPTFDPQQEKETYQRTRKEILGPDWVASTSSVPPVVDMPLVCDRTIPENPLEKVSTLREFLRSCVELMKDETVLNALCEMIDHCAQEREIPTAQRVVNQVLCKKRTNGEFRLSAQIGEYDVDNVILDLGSDVNVLPKKTWEMMGKPKLIWSPIQLRLENQHKIVPIGRLIGIPVNIDGVCSIADFEVIEIVDDSQPYPTLMGLEWAFDNQEIINLKRREMIFEVGDLKVTMPLDPTEGKRYIEPTKGNEIDNLYNMTV
jgi:hypothetical protein